MTGLTAHIGLSLAAAAPVTLAHRFDAGDTCRLIEEHQATVTVAAITAYLAIANHEAARRRDLSSLSRAYSGGAPIAPAMIGDLRQRTGLDVRPAHCRERLAAYKYPRAVHILADLPKTPSGKILRRALRSRANANG